MRSLVPVALCASAEKTQSKSKFRRIDGFAIQCSDTMFHFSHMPPASGLRVSKIKVVFCSILLAFLRERMYCCWHFIESSYYLFALHESALFFLNFVRDASCSLVLISFNPNKYFNISLYTCLRSNFSILHFKENMFWAFSLMCFIFFFLFLVFETNAKLYQY